jgi:adenine-specific DNA-methyltransferase
MPTLHWLDRDEALKAAEAAPFRLLEHVPDLSAGDPAAGNMLIHGDNLDALKALLPFYAGRVRCIAIDPPYNTRSAFEHYDDNLEHSTWLSMMYPRLELLQQFLAETGSIWVCMDDNEGHYLKVLLDEAFGRKNFVANVVWQKRTSPDARIDLGDAHDNVLVYAANPAAAKFNRVALDPEQRSGFKNPDEDPRGPWASTDFSAQGWRPNQMYKITTPGGAEYEPPPGRCWVNTEDVYKELCADNRMWFGKDGRARPRVKLFLSESEGIRSWTWWPHTEVGHNQEAKKEINQLFGADTAFETPKPERLLRRILEIATNPGDIVLDSFLGSGTTAAVAHKMGRRYIGIEMGDHAVTHCVPRLKKVIEGEQGGISTQVNWKGGGGFRFYRLGPRVFDENEEINPEVRFATLAAHIWFSETRTAWSGAADSPMLGVHEGKAYYLLFNGILGDRRAQSGNVLNATTYRLLPLHAGPKVIYGEWSQWHADRMQREGIEFKQVPYELRIR